jgi:hypothetical protein
MERERDGLDNFIKRRNHDDELNGEAVDGL